MRESLDERGGMGALGGSLNGDDGSLDNGVGSMPIGGSSLASGSGSLSTGGSSSSVVIRRVREKALLRLRSWNAADSAHDTVVIAGQSLPGKVGDTLPGSTRALCLGPREWLIVSQELGASALRAHLESELVAQSLVAVDLTDGLASFEVTGPAARDLLAKGCGVDFHPRAFPSQTCARTRFAQLAVVIECLDDPSQFRLHVGRSYAAFLHGWLLDATVEFTA